MNLLDKNISYIIITSYKDELGEVKNSERNLYLEDSLYLLDYNIDKIGGFYKGNNEKSFFAYNLTKDNDTLRHDALFLLSKYEQESAIIKYNDSEIATKIFIDGRETPLRFTDYTPEGNNLSYFYNGLSFSFCETKHYNFLLEKKQLRNGMVIEYYNGTTWKEKLVENIELEWENSYKILSKYNKVRFSNR